MPGAIITIDQSRPGPVTSHGTPGVARNDIWVGWQVQLLDGAGGNSKWEWSFLSVEPGSAAQLAGADSSGVCHTQNTTVTFDLPGSYRLRLATQGGGPGNAQILVIRVRYDVNGVLANDGYILPAYGERDGESNYNNNPIAWAEPFAYIFASIRSRLHTLETAGGGGGSPTGAAGGDLSSTYPNPRVTGLTHVTSNLLFQQAADAVINPAAGYSLILGSVSNGVALGSSGGITALLGTVQSTNLATGVLSTTGLATLNSLSAGASSLGATQATGLTVGGQRPLLAPMLLPVSLISGLQQTASTGADERGFIGFNPAAFSVSNGLVRTVYFAAVLECAVAGQTCSLELFNVTDGVTVCTLTTSSTSPVLVTSAALAVPADLPNSLKNYGARLKRIGGTVSNLVSCKMARLEVYFS